MIATGAFIMKKPKPVPEEKDDTPYERFERLAKTILAVPKSEIDKREAEYQREKKVATKRKVA